MLRLIGSAIGPYIVGVSLVCIIALGGYVWWLRSDLETARSDLAIALSETASLRRDQSATDAAVAAADRLLTAERARATALQESLDAYETEIASRPGRDACRLDDADARRLRDLAK